MQIEIQILKENLSMEETHHLKHNLEISSVKKNGDDYSKKYVSLKKCRYI